MNPSPDVPTTLSSLSSLIHNSQLTLNSLSHSLNLPNTPIQTQLIPCPLNPHHRVPPRADFSHYLRCLHPQPPENHGSTFFYNDCHGVVCVSDSLDFDKALTLPSALSAEKSSNLSGLIQRERLLLLPSDYWVVENEVEGWNSCPCVYTKLVQRVILGLSVVKEIDLADWVVSNSVKYGVVIDVCLGEHVVLLVGLCLKAILREGMKYIDLESGGKFECPDFLEGLNWLGSQLSVLYGEVNGRLFGLNIVKHCLLEAALGLLVFPLERNEAFSVNEGVDGNGEVTKPVSSDGDNGVVNGVVIDKVVSVSQVEAAVAALHERFLLEGRIKGERVWQTLPRYQRVLQHDYVTQRADEERKNRSQYKPIIEHDGLPRKKSNNQETNKTKTREELLAEERDYKRRRMSYRGKKVKRTTLQVTRDIIEDYMEEITKAGGIGCFEQPTEEQESFPLEPPTAPDFTLDDDNPTKQNNESERGSPSRTRNESRSHYGFHSTTSRHASDKEKEKPRWSVNRQRGYSEDERSASRNRNNRVNYSRSPERSRSRGRSHQQKEQDQLQITNSKHHLSSRSSKYHDSRSSSRSNSLQKSPRDRKTYESHSSVSREKSNFDDRYDPLESHDVNEEDLSTSKKYARGGRYSVNEADDN